MSNSRPAPFAIVADGGATKSESRSHSPSIPPSTLVAATGDFNYFGPLDITTLAQSAGSFIASNLEPPVAPTKITDTLLRFITSARADCELFAQPADKHSVTDACWLTVRMNLPTEEWQMPRWHQDGRMFDCTCSGKRPRENIQQGGDQGSDHDNGVQDRADPSPTPHSKYATVLLGPPTRLLRPSERVTAAMAGKSWMKRREELAVELEGCEEEDVHGAGPEAMVRFSWGEDDSPVHSEPDFTGQHRVFVSILFGNEQEIINMCKHREAKYGVVET